MSIVTQKIEVHIDYEDLREWLLLQRERITVKELAMVAGYSPSAVGLWMKTGQAFPGDAIYRIKEHYGLDSQYIEFLFLNGRIPDYTPPAKVVQIDLADLRALVEEREATI